jgi:hypothetical protein
MVMESRPLAELQTIPGIGKSISLDLYRMGIHRVSDLKNKNPEKLYAQSNHQKGAVQDRCLLYTFRCAVYFSKTKNPNPTLLKWWNWKDTLKIKKGRKG